MWDCKCRCYQPMSCVEHPTNGEGNLLVSPLLAMENSRASSASRSRRCSCAQTLQTANNDSQYDVEALSESLWSSHCDDIQPYLGKSWGPCPSANNRRHHCDSPSVHLVLLVLCVHSSA